jgi:hypothetical protein
MSQNKIVFCLPGKQYSGKFLTCWTKLIHHCINKNYTMYFSQRYTSNVYYVRSMCLGADVRKGKHQKPFDGTLDYDYIMWIDSDIIFTVENFEKLMSNNVDICGGLYLMDGGKQFAAVKNWDEKQFEKNGTFDFLTPDDISHSPSLMKVSYTGFGFLLIKKGVFEKIEYPWFAPKFTTIGDCYDFASEDVSFCLKAKEYGFDVNIDPTVWVRHEKTTEY